MRIPEGAAPDVKNRSFTVTAEVVVHEGGADGMILTQGGRFAGWALMVLDGRPVFAYAASNQPQHKYRVVGDRRLEPGRHTVKADFAYDGGGRGKDGTATITVDGTKVGEGRIDRTVSNRFSLGDAMDVGRDLGPPVIEDYAGRMPFAFNGTIDRVLIELGDRADGGKPRADAGR